MRLTRLYSNQSDVFGPIPFNPGLNVVLAEIRNRKNRNVDTHNLGKTTLGRLIDFCLLRKVDDDFFLVQHKRVFEDFVFFLELQVRDDEMLTLRRAAAQPSKISIKRHPSPMDLTDSAEREWEFADVPIERARQIVDGILNQRVLADWGFRNAIGYLVRVQNDYSDVFRLDKHRGKDAEWKPALAHLLGLDGSLVQKCYELDAAVADQDRAQKQLRLSLHGLADEPDKLEGLIGVKEEEVRTTDEQLSQFDFRDAEANINRELVDSIEADIAVLNEERYYIGTDVDDIRRSLDTKVKFDLKRVKELFEEAGVLFGDAVVNSYEDLLQFYGSITAEREQYLRKELRRLEARLHEIEDGLNGLNERRRLALAILQDHETFHKYRALAKRLAGSKADLESLYRQRQAFADLRKGEAELHRLADERFKATQTLDRKIQSQPERYRDIRQAFARITKHVVGHSAVLSSSINSAGNISFDAAFTTPDGVATSEDDGTSYKKLLCIAFDLALLYAYREVDAFPHFVFHDGALEALDHRRRLNLIEEMRGVAAHGVQQVITVIDSDLPMIDGNRRFDFDDSEVVVRLHDRGREGRLFKMAAW